MLSVYGCSLSLSASIDEVNDSAAQASMDEVIYSACGKDTVRLIEAALIVVSLLIIFFGCR